MLSSTGHIRHFVQTKILCPKNMTLQLRWVFPHQFEYTRDNPTQKQQASFGGPPISSQIMLLRLISYECLTSSQACTTSCDNLPCFSSSVFCLEAFYHSFCMLYSMTVWLLVAWVTGPRSLPFFSPCSLLPLLFWGLGFSSYLLSLHSSPTFSSAAQLLDIQLCITTIRCLGYIR